MTIILFLSLSLTSVPAPIDPPSQNYTVKHLMQAVSWGNPDDSALIESNKHFLKCCMTTFAPLVVNQCWDMLFFNCHAHMICTANWGGACRVLVTEVPYCCILLGREGRHLYNSF